MIMLYLMKIMKVIYNQIVELMKSLRVRLQVSECTNNFFHVARSRWSQKQKKMTDRENQDEQKLKSSRNITQMH